MPRRTIENITAEYNRFKGFVKDSAALSEIAPYMDSNLKPVMKNLYKRMVCMGTIVKLAETGQGSKEAQEILNMKQEELEKYDNYFIKLDSNTRTRIEDYFENEQHAELFKNSAWSAAYSCFMNTENLKLTKLINDSKTLAETMKTTKEEIAKIAAREKDENGRNIDQLNRDIAELHKKRKLLQETINNAYNKKNNDEFINEQKKEYESLTKEFNELVQERDSVPGLTDLIKKHQDARKKLSKIETPDRIFSKQALSRADKLYSKRALNKGLHTNSKEFDKMISALDKIRGTNGDLNKMKETLENLKQDASKYLEEKNKQTRLFPSAMRKQRMEYANDLISFADDFLKEMDDPDIKKEMQNQAEKKEMQKQAEQNKTNEKEKVLTDADKRQIQKLEELLPHLM